MEIIRYSGRILIKIEFSRQILEKNLQISNLMKIRQVGAELFHADGQTDMTKLTDAVLNFMRMRLKTAIRKSGKMT